MKTETIQRLIEEVEQILEKVRDHQVKHAHFLDEVLPKSRRSASNLIHYMGLRSFDLRKLQRRLGYIGMSRLARAESHVEASLMTTLFYLRGLVGDCPEFLSEYTVSI